MVTKGECSNELSATTAEEMQPPDRPPANFETAINAAGFGLYNIRLLFVVLLILMGCSFETSTISYVLPSAECDLKLTLFDKGVLNAITYAGMITSGIVWGYVADIKGRKTVLLLGLLFGALTDICCSISQNVLQLMILKFIGGFVMSGPFAVIMSYLSEMHGKSHRARIMLTTGFMFAIATVMLPALALFIFSTSTTFQLGYFNFYPWQVFLAASATPSLLGGLFLLLFPESPKFLMSQGRNEEALEVFKYIYSINKRLPKESYPIKQLLREDQDEKTKIEISTIYKQKGTSENVDRKNKKSLSLQKGLLQLKPLFKKPYLKLSMLVYLTNFFVLMGQNTMRLWLPQLFASINEYEVKYDKVSNMCDIVEFCVNKTATMSSTEGNTGTCEVIITPSTYMNNLIVGFTNFAGFTLVSLIINLAGTKRVLLTGLLVSGTCGIGLFWATSATATLIISALYTTFGSIASTAVTSSSVNLFPTSLRTIIVSASMIVGRAGSVIGNVIFPVFMSLGCVQPFFLVSLVMFSAFICSLFFPNTTKMSLK